MLLDVRLVIGVYYKYIFGFLFYVFFVVVVLNIVKGLNVSELNKMYEILE